MVTRVDKYLGGLGIDATGKLEVTDNASVVVGNGNTTGNVYAGTINSGGVELRSNDYATLLSARSNDFTTYSVVLGGITGANTAILNLQTGLSGTNTNLSDNVAIFNGAFTGSNTRLAGAESNVISLQGGLAGANSVNTTQTTNITNLQTGLNGANTNISAITNSPITFQSNVTILGNLTLSGNTTIINANTISFGDSLLSLASNSTSDTIDIGLYGHYSGGGYSNNHTGIIRSVASQDWLFFAAYAKEEPSLTLDISNSTFALANIRVRTANASLNVFAANALISPLVYSNGVELRANDYATYLMAVGGISSANTAINNLNAGLIGANTNINNLTAGLVGANTNITSLQGGLAGSNTTIALKANTASPTFTGTVTLGSNSNVKITGGTANQYLQTDGAGNLSYSTVQGVPTASIIMYGANTAPSGWLVCDGTAVSRTTYAALFAVVSNTFGIGDNSTTFNLPDFRGRAPYGVDASQSITIGSSSAGKINISFQNSTGTGTTGTGTTGTSTTGTSATAVTATTSNTSTTIASTTSTGTSGTGTGTIPAATYSTGSGTGTIPAITYSTGTGTTGTGTTGTGTTGTGTSGSGGAATLTYTTVSYQQPALVKDQSPNALLTGVSAVPAHTHAIPGLSVPGLSVPGLSIPALSIPAMNVSVPGLSIPTMSVSVPGLSIPALTIPSLTVNTHTHNVPALTIPGLSIPGLSIPGLSVPALTVTYPAEVVQFIIKT
jgi:microcystin-dependent protein